MIYKFRIELTGSNPLIWREVVIPEYYTLYQLHLVIQAAFGWDHSHLFQFSKTGLADDVRYSIPPDIEDIGEITDARMFPVKKVFRKKGDTETYVYDFGDHWVHRVTLEARINKNSNRCPVCTDGGGACPPEDVGGLGGYYQMVNILKTPANKEYSSYREWLGLVPGEEWRVDFCSIREANKRIAMLVAASFDIKDPPY